MTCRWPLRVVDDIEEPWYLFILVQCSLHYMTNHGLHNNFALPLQGSESFRAYDSTPASEPHKQVVFQTITEMPRNNICFLLWHYTCLFLSESDSYIPLGLDPIGTSLLSGTFSPKYGKGSDSYTSVFESL